MADKRISALDTATALGGTEQLPIVQSGTTKKTTVNDLKNYLIATNLTAQASVNVDLADYPDAHIVHLSWSGANGTATYTLPTASSSTNRKIRFITDNTFDTNTRVDLTPASGDTLDGGGAYEINKAYEGIALWSDGTEWFIIQKKA
jgi:hypothetical protein